MKKLLLLLLVTAFAFVGCSDDDITISNIITVGKGTVVETLVVEDGQTAIIEGTVNTLTVKGGDVAVEKGGKVGALTINEGEVVVKDGGKVDALTVNGGNVVVEKGGNVVALTVNGGDVVVNEGGNVDALTVKGGDVVIEKGGKVNSITIPAAAGAKDKPTIIIKTDHRNIGPITNTGGALIYWTAYNAADLHIVLEKPANQNSGALLGNDIASAYDADANLGAYNVGSYDQATALLYQPTPYDGYVLDGQGFTLTGAAQQNVLFISSHNVTVKNITVTQTAADKTAHKNNGVQVYWVTGVKFENVTITNCGRAGMIINGSTATATDLKSSANAWGGVNVGFPGSPNEGAKNPEFTMTNDGDLKDNFKIYVDQADFARYKVTVPAGWEHSDVQEATKITRAYYPKGQAPVVPEV